MTNTFKPTIRCCSMSERVEPEPEFELQKLMELRDELYRQIDDIEIDMKHLRQEIGSHGPAE